jgi:hypothetical protein
MAGGTVGVAVADSEELMPGSQKCQAFGNEKQAVVDARVHAEGWKRFARLPLISLVFQGQLSMGLLIVRYYLSLSPEPGIDIRRLPFMITYLTADINRDKQRNSHCIEVDAPPSLRRAIALSYLFATPQVLAVVWAYALTGRWLTQGAGGPAEGGE